MMYKIISKIIKVLGKITLAKREEQIAVSNLFSNNVKRSVRNHYDYQTNCYVDLSK